VGKERSVVVAAAAKRSGVPGTGGWTSPPDIVGRSSGEGPVVRARRAVALAVAGATLGLGLVGPGRLTMIDAISGKSGFFQKMVGIGQKWAEKPRLLLNACISEYSRARHT
jgi:hypothetical protein